MLPKPLLPSLLLLVLTLPALAEKVGGIDDVTGTVYLALSQEPRSLNTLTAESVSYTAGVLIHLQEGLMRYDNRRRLVGGVAERWEQTATDIRFWLRPEARWANGQRVTAHDFVFSWRQLVNADTASPSANLTSPIKNAKAILKGDRESSALGVTAVNDQELLVQLEHPCAWCLKLMTNSIFYPINKTFFEQAGEQYGTSPETHLSNGAFILKRWDRGKRIHLARNDSYWRRDDVHIANLHFDTINTDAKTIFNLFRAGEIAQATLNRDTIPDAMNFGFRMRTFPTGHLFNIQFSHLESKPTANLHFRKALTLVIDKNDLVHRVVATPGTRIADSMFHDWLTVENTRFIKARPPLPHSVDIEAAKRHLAIARQELNLGKNISVTLTMNDSSLYRRIAEYLQHRFKRHLNIDLKIDPQITQMMVEKWRQGSSDMTLITWPVDVDDPMDQISFMGNPDFRSVFRGLYAGDDMAALYRLNRNATVLEERLNAIALVQKFFHEKVTTFPLFESYGATVTNPRLRGYIWQPVRGYADYRYAIITDR